MAIIQTQTFVTILAPINQNNNIYSVGDLYMSCVIYILSGGW